MNRAAFTRIYEKVKKSGKSMMLMTSAINNGSSHLIAALPSQINIEDDTVLELNHTTAENEHLVYYIPYSEIKQVIEC